MTPAGGLLRTPVKTGALLSVAGLAACHGSPSSPRACTLIGCANGFAVVVNGVPPQTLVTVVAGPSATPSAPLTCTADGNGSCPVYFDGGSTPPTVTVQVSWTSNTATFTVQPVYQVSQPNGPDCEPTCHWAIITLSV